MTRAARASGSDAVAAGWHWLSTLPRTATPHAARGARPLAAIEALLAALDDPHRELRVVHVAGSKGKGSTALFVEALLERLGRRTFTFTSPHLQRWTERLRLDGAEADAGDSLDALEAVRAAAARTGIAPGFFEALTAAGLLLARRAGVDWAIVEAGVGGRADATNVVMPQASVITGVELEHTERLGDSIEAIAGEKAGIVKPGVPLLAPLLGTAADEVLAAAAARANAQLVRLRRSPGPARAGADPDSVRWHWEGGTLTVGGAGWSVRTALASAGAHMAGNAALALATVARLGLVSQESLQQAARLLRTLQLPGRMETVSRLPWVVIDGAHTRASSEALAEAVRELRPARLHLLLSLTAGRDPAAVLGPLLPLADAVSVTRADREHSLAAATLADAVRAQRPGLAVHADDDLEAALAGACDDRPGATLVLATGSVYLAGAVRAAFLAAGA